MLSVSSDTNKEKNVRRARIPKTLGKPKKPIGEKEKPQREGRMKKNKRERKKKIVFKKEKKTSVFSYIEQSQESHSIA